MDLKNVVYMNYMTRLSDYCMLAVYSFVHANAPSLVSVRYACMHDKCGVLVGASLCRIGANVAKVLVVPNAFSK